MLRELHVRNLAVIEEISIIFDTGFTVFTGETGAGKSIIIDAISLALGSRGSKDLVRTGCESSIIEARFEMVSGLRIKELLKERGIPSSSDGEIYIQREIGEGISRCRINGSMQPLSVLAELSQYLVDIHGQHEHQSLLREKMHLAFLDEIGELQGLKRKYQGAYQRYMELGSELQAMRDKEAERKRRMDILRFQVEEIRAVDPKLGEDEELQAEAAVLANAQRLIELAGQAWQQLDDIEGSVMDKLRFITRNLEDIAILDARQQSMINTSKEAMVLLEELSYSLRDYIQSIDYNPDRLYEVEERIATLQELKRKYGNTIEAVLDYYSESQDELSDLEKFEVRMESLESEFNEQKRELLALAEGLTKKRKEAATRLKDEVTKQLGDLAMAKTGFEAAFKNDDIPLEQRVTANGADRVEFLISLNPGEALRPMSKIASGGELSRLMLALKVSLRRADTIPTLIFDEVDAGIGGAVAEAVGQKLKTIADGRQVICITHLPQIAALADHFIKINKLQKEGRTYVEASALHGDEIVEELARMLGGKKVTEITRKHAREYLAQSVMKN